MIHSTSQEGEGREKELRVEALSLDGNCIPLKLSLSNDTLGIRRLRIPKF